MLTGNGYALLTIPTEQHYLTRNIKQMVECGEAIKVVGQENIMNENITSYLENDRFAALVGVKLVEVKHGYAKAKMEITDKHLNAVNIVQGGAIFTLADFAFAAASNSYGQVSLGINANISYFRPPKGSALFAEAKEISSSKKIGNYTVDIFDENDEIVARFNGIAYRKKDMIVIE
jgi:acyl-CoA thioesterase